jgi:terminase, large subunit
MNEYEGVADRMIEKVKRVLRPPPRLTLSEWADQYYYLSPETAAIPGKWKTIPYQKGIMDAITDPLITQVSLIKSARIGYTLACVCAPIAYYMHQDPTSILVAQPTVEDAKGFSKESIAPMLRDVPVLSKILFEDDAPKGPKDASATMLHKKFPGGVLSLVGSNSGTGFRRVSRRVIIFDEVDAYPPSAGSEGDPIRLGIKRSENFWNRKIIAGSTPLIAGASRIETLFLEGDQRRYYVPCLTCGHMDFLTFREGVAGHWMAWPEGKPEEAHFVCRACGVAMEHKDKREMVERGEWRAHAPFRGHASFHAWAAYSYSPNATWADIAKEFVAANAEGPRALQTFVNTVLGETWSERGDAPDWARLYQRREDYEAGVVSEHVRVITCGVDVQRDRLVWEVVGWGDDRQSWSIDAGVIPGDTSKEDQAGPWGRLDELIARQWPRADGVLMPIQMTAVDSGDQTQTVYGWARQHLGSRVIATKGMATAKSIIGSPTAVDVTIRGKKFSRGGKVWPVGSAIVKTELYGWLKQEPPLDGQPFPPGWCHFPSGYGEEYFRQLTGEQLVMTTTKSGFTVREWQAIPGRENHFLDCRVYARAAATLLGIDRLAAKTAIKAATEAPKVSTAPLAVQTRPIAPQVSQVVSAPKKRERRGGGWMSGGRSGGGGWMGR